jgi:hypothetical protein
VRKCMHCMQCMHGSGSLDSWRRSRPGISRPRGFWGVSFRTCAHQFSAFSQGRARWQGLGDRKSGVANIHSAAGQWDYAGRGGWNTLRGNLRNARDLLVPQIALPRFPMGASANRRRARTLQVQSAFFATDRCRSTSKRALACWQQMIVQTGEDGIGWASFAHLLKSAMCGRS